MQLLIIIIGLLCQFERVLLCGISTATEFASTSLNVCWRCKLFDALAVRVLVLEVATACFLKFLHSHLSLPLSFSFFLSFSPSSGHSFSFARCLWPRFLICRKFCFILWFVCISVTHFIYPDHFIVFPAVAVAISLAYFVCAWHVAEVIWLYLKLWLLHACV